MNDQTPLTRQERIIIALHQLLREIREHAGLDAGTALADLPQAIADLRKRADAAAWPDPLAEALNSGDGTYRP